MGLLDDLSTGWLSLAVFAAMYVLAAAIYLCVMALATGRRAVAFKAVSPGLLPPMGLLFALLVGFLVAQVWSDSARAQQAVDREASALRSVDLLTDAFPDETDARMRVLIHRHVDEAVTREWPAMAEGKATLSVVPAALDDALQLALALTPTTEGQTTAQREIVASLQAAFDARRQRIIVSEFRVTWVTWSGVILVAALTLLAIAFVQSDNRLAAAIAMGLFASAVASALILIAAHDRPFTGDARVRPDVLQQVDPGAP